MASSQRPWALILGGSSGMGLSTAKKLGVSGYDLCIVHRDRRGAMSRIESEFAQIRSSGAELLALNMDALSASARREIITTLGDRMGGAHLRLVLHSIALGNLKPLVATESVSQDSLEALARILGVSGSQVEGAVRKLWDEGHEAFTELLPSNPITSQLLSEEDFAETIANMGTSLTAWVQDLHQKGLLARDARVIGLTSEGNQIAWPGYAAVSAAKNALEACARSIAREFAPHGIRCNIIQAGVTDTPALRQIPGSDRLLARARRRNPFGRITRPEDVANAVYLLGLDEAAWINGAILRVDGGEAIST